MTRKKYPKPFLFVAIQLLFFACVVPLDAQIDEQAITAELTKLKSDVANNADMDDETRKVLEKQLAAFESSLSEVDETVRKLEINLRATESVMAESEKVKTETGRLKESPETTETEIDESGELPELEKQASDLETTIQNLQRDIQAAELSLEGRTSLREKIEGELGTLDGTLIELDRQIALAEPLSESVEERANLLELVISRYKANANKRWLQSRLVRDEAEESANLIRDQLELNQLKLAGAKELESRLTELINLRVQERTEQETQEALNEAARIEEQFPVLSTSEQITAELAQRIQDIENKTITATANADSLKDRLFDLEQKFVKTIKRVQTIGASGSTGAMLRKRKAELPDTRATLQQASEARQKIEEIQFEKFELEEQLSELSAETIRDEIDLSAPLSAEAWEALAEPVKGVVERRREKLNSLTRSLDRLFEAQLDIESNDNLLTDRSNQFAEYINERILWIRSNQWLFSELSLDKQDAPLVDSSRWQKLREPFLDALNRSPLWFGIGGITLFLLLCFKPSLRSEVDRLGEVASLGNCATFWPTVRATALTLVVAAVIPLIVLGVGQGLLRITPTNNILFDVIAKALVTAGVFAIPLEVLRRTCRANGLAVNHFDWPNTSVSMLKGHLTWYIVPASSLVFLVALLNGIDSTHRIDLLERVFYVAGMALTALFLYRVFSPKSGIFKQYLKEHTNSWANQTSFIWFAAILAMPVFLGMLAAAGYYYTALNLAYCLFATFTFAVIAELVRALVRRFVLVRKRNAQIETARRKRDAELAARREVAKRRQEERQRAIAAGQEVPAEPESMMTTETLAELQTEEIDIDINAGQANQLINLTMIAAWVVGLWLIWSDVLPAIKALDDYILWPAESVVAVEEPTEVSVDPMAALTTSAAPAQAAKPTASESNSYSAVEISRMLDSEEEKVDVGISLREFLIFLAISVITFVSARNLPNAVEMLFLKELPVDRSARFATKALISYAIVILGTVLAFRTLNVNWSNIQWLVTALTFGLAFGLQEIFANFVAGIILMFERPMRIGDLITVDDFTGVVTRIRTRATTIVNWDRKEYVIPNKDFITGRLINWTLSDAINRIQFTVGIAYGSDVKRAKELLYEICANHPKIVDDPGTIITFEEFADSSLNLVIRTFLGEVDSRLRVVDQLHMRINEAFEKAGIEISFPQQDIHVRSYSTESIDPAAAVDPSAE